MCNLNNGKLKMNSTNPYRSKRTIRSFGISRDADVTVIVGLYNAVEYLPGLIKQIESQTYQNVKWLFLDNDSIDSTYRYVEAWLENADLDAVLVKNPINLGATGSYFANFDLVDSNWITFIHQDDIYTSKFVEDLFSTAAAAPKDVILIYGDMGRVDENGKKLGAYPSSSWMLPDNDQVTLFLSLIRNHCIPWPAMMVRSDVFVQVEPFWHSASFPDTEATLMLSAMGKFQHIPVELMKYRDNLSSESRSLLDDERQFGSALGLLRVFSSGAFQEILSLVRENEKEQFIKGLLNSVEVRIPNPNLNKLVTTYALEIADNQWAHSSPFLLNAIAEKFEAVAATRTLELLERMSIFAENSPSNNNSYEKVFTELSVEKSHSNNAFSLKAFLLKSYSKFGGFLPYKIRKFIFPKIIRVFTRQSTHSAWNFSWRG